MCVGTFLFFSFLFSRLFLSMHWRALVIRGQQTAACFIVFCFSAFGRYNPPRVFTINFWGFLFLLTYVSVLCTCRLLFLLLFSVLIYTILIGERCRSFRWVCCIYPAFTSTSKRLPFAVIAKICLKHYYCVPLLAKFIQPHLVIRKIQC